MNGSRDNKCVSPVIATASDNPSPVINGKSGWEDVKSYLEERMKNYVKALMEEEMSPLQRTLAQLNTRICYLEGIQPMQNGDAIPTIQENHRESDEMPGYDACYSPNVSVPSGAVTPFTSPGRSGFGNMAEQPRSSAYDFLQSRPNVDFFRSCSDNDSLDGHSNGTNGNGFMCLPNSLAKRAQGLNVVPESRGGSTSSIAVVGGSSLRRSNSKNSRRNRRMSLPDAFSVNRSGWPVAAYSGRPSAGSFIGNGSEDFGETGADEAFAASETVTRSSSNMQELEIRCRFGELGQGRGQLNAPHGFCLSENQQEIIIADTNNHRIHSFDQQGNLRWTYGTPGRRDGQLWYPRKVAWLGETRYQPARLVVCDRGQERSRIQIFTVRRDYCAFSRENVGNRDPLAYQQTIQVDYVAIVAGMTVYRNRILIVDSVHPACLAFEPNGYVTFWFDCSTHMKEPSDIVVANDHFYICDFKGHCVCVYNGKGDFVTRIGDHNIINFPNGISVGLNGNVYVGDSHGNRFHVAVYSNDGEFLSEYECPHMKYITP
ncbi:brain tumor protein-like isoform X2 [Paramacrobiotus metropolitanus]|uniref:brain tumor protein-like isoform X2 n=1 Tax=Paramacrobiotus metropolitanus TaxID=2943436 RepID=UPI0024464589|nr:brain tumor protein-like isoform X2 [Paramacrobiotus metropolitanus]